MNTFRKILIATTVSLLACAPALEAAAQIRGSGRASVGGHAGVHAGAARAPAGGGVRPGANGGGIRNTGDRNSGNAIGNRTNNNSGNNNGNRINTGDININTDDHDHDWDWDDHYHPVAAGIAFGTAAAVTSAVVGSMIYSLPPACSPYAGGYYYCGGVYYAPQYQGDRIVYVVVDRP